MLELLRLGLGLVRLTGAVRVDGMDGGEDRNARADGKIVVKDWIVDNY